MLLFQKRKGISIYQRQSNAVMDAALRRGRLRLGNAEIFSRDEAGKALFRAIRKGDAFFNLPDMDFGLRDAAFVPFFGVPAVTLLAPSRLAKALDMVVQPVVAEILPGGQGYRVRFEAPWADFPTDDPVADAARMNRWIESGDPARSGPVPVGAPALQDAAAGRAFAVLTPRRGEAASIIAPMRVRFTKMQGAGNDFVVLDATRAPLALDAAQMQSLGRPPLRRRRRPDPGRREGAAPRASTSATASSTAAAATRSSTAATARAASSATCATRA